jgi:immune inhibitor A
MPHHDTRRIVQATPCGAVAQPVHIKEEPFMKRPLKYCTPGWFAAAAVVAALFFGAIPAFANPAMQGVVKTFTQPDQSRLDLRLWGDEYANGWETLEGYTVLLNPATGYWEWAMLGTDGAVIPSGQRVGVFAPTEAPHLRPTDEALAESYRRNGAVGLPGEPRLPMAPPWATGSTNVLVILVQFPADAADPQGPQPAVNASFTAAQVQANLFGGTPTGPGNMTDFYNEISFNNLNLVGTVVGPFTVTNDKNDYDDGPSNSGALVAQAIALADPTVDFAPFDNDGNGEVDMVAIAYAGNGPDNGNYTGANATTNDLWPHAASIGAVNVDGGARSVSQYFIAAELLNSTPRLRTIGVYCHEFGHKLGLPDLYDTDNSSDGVGHWSLMGSGSWCSNTPGSENGESPSHMDPWCKWWEGWITPTDRTDDHIAQVMTPAETNPFAVRLLANPGGPNDWPGGSGQYFLIENRQRLGFDVGIDGCGIVVWHIDEALTNNRNEGHTAGTHRLVDVEEADGSPQDLDNGTNRGDTGDPFPGSSNNMLWDDDSNPSARLYNGDPSDQAMRVVTTSCGGSMTVSFNNAPPVADAGTDIVAECTSSTTTSVQLNGTGSSDPDGDALTYTWSATGITFDDIHSATATGQFPGGATNVTLTVSDGTLEDTDVVIVTIVDTTPPVIACPDDITVECSSFCGVEKGDDQLVAFFEGVSAIDTCDPTLTITNDAPDCFPDGDTIVKFKVEDADGNADSCTSTVTVEDTTPPEIVVELNRDVLWPPNHKLAEVCAEVTVTDICDEHPTFTLYSIESSEPENDKGDGNTLDDIQDDELGTVDTCFALRSERQGGGDGRKYTVIYEGKDFSDNVAYDTVCVRVPHDQSAHALASFGFSADGATVTGLTDKVAVIIPATAGMDVASVAASDIYLGNTDGVLRPIGVRTADANKDGLLDLVLFFDTMGVQERLAGSAPASDEGIVGINGSQWSGPVGVHFVSAAETDYLVANIFALGAAVPLPSFVTEPPSPLGQGAPTIQVVRETGLSSIHPNPFNPQTTVEFALSSPQRVRIMIYDVRGSLVHRLVDQSLGAGEHRAVWNGIDDAGRPATSGIYFVRMVAGSYEQTRKIVMLK